MITDYLAQNYIPVPESGCWLWLGTWGTEGYGRVNKHGRDSIGAHRLFFQHFVGPIPEGMFVCHKCDVRACVNPDHLFAGTPQQNSLDMTRKGRHRPNPRLGEAVPQSKLTGAQVLSIFGDPRTQRAIASDYGVAPGLVSSIKTGYVWGHLTGMIYRGNRKRPPSSRTARAGGTKDA